MTSATSLTNLSSRELFELAKAKEEEESLEARERSKEILRNLRRDRRRLIAEQRKALGQLDAKIAELAGTKAGVRQGSRRTGSSRQVLEILEAAGAPLSTKAIREELGKRRISIGHLAQTLAYLKRRGKVSSPARAHYMANIR